MCLPWSAGCLALFLTWFPASVLAVDRLIVEAGPVDRQECPIDFPWDDPVRVVEAVADDGSAEPVQAGGGRAWMVVRDLPRGATRIYRLRPATGSSAPRCEGRHDGEHVELSLAGRRALRYLAGPGQLPRNDIAPEYRRGGYLHPVWTPSGRPVTDDYPPNHLHQHGLWSSWTSTSFEGRKPDFWNMGKREGRTDFEALEWVVSGPVFAGFRSGQVFTDLQARPPKVALTETWTVRLWAIGAKGGFHAFDVDAEQRCATDSAIGLPKYHYGGFASRGLWGWNGPTNVLYLDSNGTADRVVANESRPRWYWMGGPAGEGEGIVGFAVLGHPTNFRTPQPLRMHPTEPYACWSPSQLGDWEIRPGEPYVSRYRVVVLDGAPDRGLLDRLWNDYADPPKVRPERSSPAGVR